MQKRRVTNRTTKNNHTNIELTSALCHAILLSISVFVTNKKQDQKLLSKIENLNTKIKHFEIPKFKPIKLCKYRQFLYVEL
jgi:hypothetical protein